MSKSPLVVKGFLRFLLSHRAQRSTMLSHFNTKPVEDGARAKLVKKHDHSLEVARFSSLALAVQGLLEIFPSH